MKLPIYQRGYLLVTVIVTMFLVATIATLLNYDSAISANTTTGELEAAQADYVVQAAMQHAVWRANQSSCSGYAAPMTSLGAHSYSATFSPTFGSPTNIVATGIHASGVTRNLSRTDVPVYDLATPMTGMLMLGAEGEDTYVEGDPGHVDHNKGNDNELWTSSATGGEYRALLRFDLSGLPPTATIQTATLELYLNSHTSTDVVEAHRLLRDWTEDGVTWNDYDGVNSWSTAGGDYDPDVAGSFLADSVGPKSMDITDLAKAWVDGSLPNYGLMLLSPPAAGGGTNKYHSGEKVTEPWPRLTLSFVCECDTSCPGIAVSSDVVLSTDSDAVLGGLSFTDVDLADYDAASGNATMYFEGGLTTLDKDIDAIHLRENGHIVLSTKDAATLGGLSFEPGDLVEYDPVADTATMFFDGSLHFPEAENIISVHVLRNGGLVLSTDSAAVLGGVSFSDKVLVKYDPVGRDASIFFDGDAAGLTEDITAVHILENGHIVMAAKGNTSLGGLSVTPADLIEYDPTTDSAFVFFAGSALFDDPAEKIISAHIDGDFGPAGYILLVVGDAASPATKDIDRRNLFESWGYVVTLIDDDASQAEFDTEAAATDVIYVSGTIDELQVAGKLDHSPTSLVNEDWALMADYGFSEDEGYSSTDDTLTTDPLHYITEPFAGGTVVAFTSSVQMNNRAGPISSDLDHVARIGFAGTTLGAIPAGADRWDGTPAPARRLHVPFENAEISQLTPDGLTLLQRSLEWAAGAGPKFLPIAHWKLDDGTGLVAVDSEGGHDGILTNGPAWATGQVAGGLDFDAFDDYVDLGSNVELNDIFDGGATVTAWIYLRGWGESDNGRILDKASQVSGDRDGWMLAVRGATPAVQFAQGFTGVRGFWRSEAGTVTLNNWVHVAVVYDASSVANDAKIYLDGVEQSPLVEITPTGTIATDAGISLRMGNYAQDTSRTFDGIIDDVRIYERMLSDAEIAELATPPSNSPVAHWKLDETSGTTAVDSEGGHDGTLANGPVWSAGQDGGALLFDGSNDYVDLTSDSDLGDVFLGGATVMAWIEPTGWGENGYGRIFDKSSSPSSTGDGWVVRMNTDNGGIINFGQGFTGGRGWWKIPNGSINLNAWQHIAVAYDASSPANDPAIYLNGSPLVVTRVDSPSGSVRSDTAINLRLGNHAGGTAHTFAGKIDDARIYDQMLSQEDIAELAAPPLGLPIAHWKMDDGAGLTAIDSAGGHDGTLVNGPGWTAGNLNGGLSFDGANDYVNVPHNDALSITEKMTFTAWINSTSFGASYQTIIAKDGGGSGSNYYFGTWQDELVFGFFSGGLFREIFTSGLSLPTGTWLHLAATFDNATNAVALYANGALVRSGSLSFNPTPVSADLRMGLSPDGERWRGLLDDVRIYDEILSESEIATLAGVGGGGGGGGPCDGTFRDEFNTISYAGSDGTEAWATNWLEINENGNVSSGDEKVDDNDSNYHLQVRDNDGGGEGVQREADLSAFSSATLSFEYRRDGFDNSNDYVMVHASSDGGANWAELDRFVGPGTDSAYVSTSYDISAHISSSTRIRFLTSPDHGSGDEMYIDNVEIAVSGCANP